MANDSDFTDDSFLELGLLEEIGDADYGKLVKMYMNEDGKFANTHLFYDERADQADYNEELITKLFHGKKRPWYFTKYGQKVGEKADQINSM